jgi:hypothetical protein
MQKYHMPNWEDSLFFKGQICGRKGRKLTPSDEPTVPSVHSVGVVGTLSCRPNEVDTVGWTDGPVSRCAGWIAEEEQWRQLHRMIRRPEWGHRRSIRGSVWIKTKMHQDEVFSIGWTDALVKGERWSIRRSCGSKQRQLGCGVFSTGWSDAPSVYSVRIVLSADLQQLSDVEGTRWNRCLENA